jgi:branched-chain amino acid transport system permease protein
VAVLLIIIAAALPFFRLQLRVFQFTLVLVYAIVLLGLNMLTGYNGQISLGHGAFYAIGAYTAAILMDKFGVPYWLTLPAAAAICLVAGIPVRPAGAAARGLYLALATFALGVAMPQLLKYKKFEHWTGGVQGIVITKPDAPFGLPLNPDRWLYLFTLLVTIVMFVIGINLLRGRIGRAMIAIRDHPIAAEAMGINISLYKALTFGVSAMFTGVGGALGAIAVQFVAPDSFTVFLSIAFVVGIVVGGLASVSGALYGAIFIQFVPNIADQISKAAPWAIYGLFLIAFMYVMPGGIAHFVRASSIGCDTGVRQRYKIPRRHQGGTMKHIASLSLLAGVLLASPVLAQKKYDTGATDTEIKIGQTMPYSGPASAYGTIGRTEVAYFQKINDEGGINGRKIKLISVDDGYSPPKTVEMIRKLVEQDEVLFVFQSLGTPSNSAIHKYMNAKKVPQLFVATGATKWGDPKDYPWTMGWQPNYQTEGRIYAKDILKNQPNAKIGVLYQNDDYGKDLLQGLKQGLGTRPQR